MFEGFTETDIATSGGARIHVVHGGKGPPLLLLHGNPETHVCWHKIADRLAEHYTVVAPDLRGYGDSLGPEPNADSSNYSFRVMGQDQIEVMQALGHARFFAAGHDRGGRTLHRMMIDHPARIAKASVLDILPAHHIWHNASKAWAMKSWHWVFMPQTADLPERMMSSVPADWLLERLISKPGQGGTALDIFAPEAWAEYLRCFTPSMIRASCADYRACATVDLAMDEEDFGRRSEIPLLVLWGGQSHTEAVFGDLLSIWRKYVVHAEGCAVDSGHFIPEHVPDETYNQFTRFFTGPL